MTFDLVTMIVTAGVILTLAIPVLVSLINLIVEMWDAFKDGKLDDEEVQRIKDKRNALAKAVIGLAGIIGIKLPWIKVIQDTEL